MGTVTTYHVSMDIVPLIVQVQNSCQGFGRKGYQKRDALRLSGHDDKG